MEAGARLRSIEGMGRFWRLEDALQSRRIMDCGMRESATFRSPPLIGASKLR